MKEEKTKHNNQQKKFFFCCRLQQATQVPNKHSLPNRTDMYNNVLVNEQETGEGDERGKRKKKNENTTLTESYNKKSNNSITMHIYTYQILVIFSTPSLPVVVCCCMN